MKHYRYDTVASEFNVTARLTVFIVQAETPCGYWVIERSCKGYITHFPELYKKMRRWVSKTSVKRYCYPTKDEAFKSYHIRQQWRVKHLEYQMRIAEAALAITTPDDTFEFQADSPLFITV